MATRWMPPPRLDASRGSETTSRGAKCGSSTAEDAEGYLSHEQRASGRRAGI